MNAAIARIDVRPILAGGGDPFREIVAAASEVPAGGSLLVIAPFNPLPLREILEASGFRSKVLRTAEGTWEVTFVRGAPALLPGDLSTAPHEWSEGADMHVDARGLDAGKAVGAVLSVLARMSECERLVAHLDSNLDRLYPELLRLGWEAVYVPGEPGEVRLEIFRT
jgi:hypothetical protein